jgi:hypothetical protein
LIPDFGVLSRAENARLWELFDAFQRDDSLTEDELTEMWALLDVCPLVNPNEAGNPYRETYEEMRVRRRLEDAFGGAFHNYAKHIHISRCQTTPIV